LNHLGTTPIILIYYPPIIIKG
ncbi:uncharacterized protein METZ01_LOCUS129025, partial [marine metagenome]